MFNSKWSLIPSYASYIVRKESIFKHDCDIYCMSIYEYGIYVWNHFDLHIIKKIIIPSPSSSSCMHACIHASDCMHQVHACMCMRGGPVQLPTISPKPNSSKRFFFSASCFSCSALISSALRFLDSQNVVQTLFAAACISLLHSKHRSHICTFKNMRSDRWLVIATRFSVSDKQ